MCGINAVGAQGSGCMLTLCHAPLKIAVLLHKTEIVCRVMLLSVVLRGLPNNHAANLIIFLENSNLHTLIFTYTFIYFYQNFLPTGWAL